MCMTSVHACACERQSVSEREKKILFIFTFQQMSHTLSEKERERDATKKPHTCRRQRVHGHEYARALNWRATAWLQRVP